MVMATPWWSGATLLPQVNRPVTHPQYLPTPQSYPHHEFFHIILHLFISESLEVFRKRCAWIAVVESLFWHSRHLFLPFLTYFVTRQQSAIPLFVMGALCIVGGVSGYVRSRSVPSLVLGVGYVFSNIRGYLTTPNASPLLHQHRI